MLGILAKAVVEKRFDKNLIKKFEEYGKISDLSLRNPKKYHAQKLKIETDILKKINKILEYTQNLGQINWKLVFYLLKYSYRNI